MGRLQREIEIACCIDPRIAQADFESSVYRTLFRALPLAAVANGKYFCEGEVCLLLPPPNGKYFCEGEVCLLLPPPSMRLMQLTNCDAEGVVCDLALSDPMDDDDEAWLSQTLFAISTFNDSLDPSSNDLISSTGSQPHTVKL